MTAIAHDTPLSASLRERHASWLKETLAAIDAGRAAGAGIWARWGAIRNLDRTFAVRFEQEREAIEALEGQLAPADVSNLWALAELLGHLRRELDRSVALHQTGEQFSRVAVKFVRALGCWCREAERAVDDVPVTTLPASVLEPLGFTNDA